MVRIVTAPAVNIITAMTEYIGILWSPVSGVELRATSESSISVEDLEVSFFLLVSVIRLPAGALSSSMVVVSTAGGVTEEVADGIGVVVADMEGEGDGVMPGVTVGVVVAGTTVGVTVGVAVAGTTDGVIVGATVGVAVAGTVVGVAVGVDVGVTVGVGLGVWISYIKDKKGKLCKAVLVKLESKKDEKTGRMRMEEIPGSEYTVAVDLVLIAAGFLGSQDYVTKAFGVEINERTNVKTEPGRYATNVKNVFTAGDMHRGQSLVVWAIREGREVAREIDESLMGYTNLNIQ